MAKQAKSSAKSEANGFWHKPAQLNLLADVLLFLGMVGMGYALVLAVVRLPMFPVRQVDLRAPLKQVTPAQIEYAVQVSVAGNFFTVDMDKVRAAFEKLPWVRRAAVKRIWPDALELELEEQVAVAQWRQNESDEIKLVNPKGELFSAALPAPLPLLVGPKERVPEVLARFRELEPLLKPLGGELQSLSLSAREAWSFHMSTGLSVELGRDQAKSPMAERLKRFVASYRDTTERLKAPVVMADLRYPNGFTVRLGRGAAAEIKGKK